MAMRLSVGFIMKARINKIIPFSNVDGPGNRMAIFFQECPFSCLYCHNPETINECINCGKCVSYCQSEALSIVNGKVIWDEKICVSCDTCIKVCPNMSSPKTKLYSIDDIVKMLKDVKPFIRGITVSGGECMNYASFILELFKEAKKLDLSCLIDSNGYYDFENYPDLLAICDGVMLDVKAFDKEFHRLVTKNDNNIVLKNLRFLLENNKLYEVRTVILPGFAEENQKTVEEVSRIIGSKTRYKLIKYRPFGVRDEGIKMFGNKIVSDDYIAKMVEIAKKNGCNTTITI